MVKILIVEDDEAIGQLILSSLKAEGYHCTWAGDGRQGADLAEAEHYDLALLDIMLPEIDGYELLEYIRPMGTPVIFLSARGTPGDRIRGLKLGADDYLSKPFQMGELLARVEAVLRRSRREDDTLVFEDVVLQPDARQVWKAGQPVPLTVKEFDLLAELIRNKNIALYREQLYEKVWQEPFTGETRTLDSHIQRLRRKLGWDKQIRTVFRIGYRLEE